MPSPSTTSASPAPEGAVVRVDARSAGAIAALHRRADPPGWSLDAWTAQLAQPATGCLARKCATGLDGFIAVSLAAGEAEILMIAVDPAVRRSGLGRLLLDTALADMAGAGARRCYLEVAADNAAALALYARCGFEQIARRAGYYANAAGSTDALVMMRELAPAGSRL